MLVGHTELLKPSVCYKNFEQWSDGSNLSIITIMKKKFAAQFLQRHTMHVEVLHTVHTTMLQLLPLWCNIYHAISLSLFVSYELNLFEIIFENTTLENFYIFSEKVGKFYVWLSANALFLRAWNLKNKVTYFDRVRRHFWKCSRSRCSVGDATCTGSPHARRFSMSFIFKHENQMFLWSSCYYKCCFGQQRLIIQ